MINEFLRYSPENYKELLVKLFNIILKTGIIPTDGALALSAQSIKIKGRKITQIIIEVYPL